MTDNEIIKALECCRSPVGSGECGNCPLQPNFNKRCTVTMLGEALDLINRQKAENERLKAENAKLKHEMSYMIRPNTIGDTHEMGAW